MLVVLLVASAAAQIEDGEDVISVDSSEVVVNATVLDAGGKYVSGLRKEQFKVFDNGVERPIEFFAAESTPFAAVILIDTSGSMEQRISIARSAAIAFLDGLRPDDSAAIYRFDSKIVEVQPFSNSRDIAERVFDLKARGMTALNDAIFKAAAELSSRGEKRKAIIVLSDGEDTSSGRSSSKALNAALAANAVIYTIDMSSAEGGQAKRMQNQGVLKNFAERSGGTFIDAPGGTAMREAFKRIVNELGVQYTLAFEPADKVRSGKWRSIEVRVARPNLSIRTRKGYTAAK